MSKEKFTQGPKKVMVSYPVIDRIQFVMNKLSVTEITPDQKREIGELVAKTFFSYPKHMYIRKEKILEKEGECDVWVYPSHFVPVMDKIIFNFFRNQPMPAEPALPSLPTEPTQPIEPVEETKPKKRKRIIKAKK